MIKTINARIFWVGVAPLALLALALVGWNGITRLNEAEQTLQAARSVSRQLLNAHAIDALALGSNLTIEQLARDVIATSPAHRCIAVLDNSRQTLIEVGQCSEPTNADDLFPIEVAATALADFTDRTAHGRQVGTLRLSMNDALLRQKRQYALLQLTLSIALILAVVFVVERLLRARLVTPLRRITTAMQSVSNRDYSTHLDSVGDDEVSQLARSINDTIRTIDGYTSELVRRRNDADRALHDADEANLARDGLVRTLTDELTDPLNRMQAELTTLAMNNSDSTARQRIKTIIATLQDAQSNFNDLIEIAANSQRPSRAAPRNLADLHAELTRSLDTVAKSVTLPLHSEVSKESLALLRSLNVSIDGDRCRKAVEYVSRALYRRCTELGVYLHLDVVKVSQTDLNVSIQLKAFCPPGAAAPPQSEALRALAGSTFPPAALGWSDRECRIIEYLLREARTTATYSISPTGTIVVLLETVAGVSDVPSAVAHNSDWMFATRPIQTTIVSDDSNLIRFTTRGTLTNHEITMQPYAIAQNSVASLFTADVLIVDISADVTASFSLLEQLKASPSAATALPKLIALCAAGPLTYEIESRLFDCGFSALLQRPIQYARLVEVIQRVRQQQPTKIQRNN